MSGQQEDDAGDRGRLDGHAAETDRNGGACPGCTVARAVVAERVDAFPRQFDAHLVGQQRNPHEKVGRREEGIEPRSVGVTVAFQVPVLEVERFVAVARRLPGERRAGEPPRPERLPLETAFAGIVVARPSSDADVEIDAGKLIVAKINIDENPQVPTKYGVRGIPTLMIFQDGQVAATKVGALPKTKIKEWIDASI